MARKPVPFAIQKKLLLLSVNTCCFEECNTKLYDIKTDTTYGEVCHINAVNSTGARFDSTLTQEQINSLDNLIMLCSDHHKTIDSNSVRYSAEYLKKIKNQHEEKYGKLLGLSDGETASEAELNIKKLLREIERIFDSKKDYELPEKNRYNNEPNYIERKLIPNHIDDTINEEFSLIELIKKENRIVILGAMGKGKSVELNHLAYFHSNDESELYPISVKLDLYNGIDLEAYLKAECPDLDKIPHKNLLVILDALDEVQSDEINKAANSIAFFSKKYQESTIVVSCRTNLYGSAEIKGFNTFYPRPLNDNEIRQYSKNVLKSDERVNSFISKVSRIGAFDVLGTPYDLASLVNYYDTEQSIPKSRIQLYDYLIEQKTKEDYKKYGNSNLKFEFYQNQLEEAIEKIAFSVQCLGRSYLTTKDEFLRIVNSNDLFEIIKRTFLFSKTDKENWAFEEKRFQEYLAAKYLAKLSSSQIQELVSTDNKKKIKPSWVNTLSNLFSILDIHNVKFNYLFDWINKIEVDVLLRFERDKINLEKRELVFSKIYCEFKKKNIWIKNEKFSSIDLARFVSDSDKSIVKILKTINKVNDHAFLVDSVSLFKYFDNINNYKEQIGNLLIKKIIDPNIKNVTKYNLLYELSQLRINNKTFTEKILKHNDFHGRKYIRAGFYNYILNSDHLENYIDLYIKGIGYVAKSEMAVSGDKTDDEDINLYDEKYALEQILEKIESEENLNKLLKCFNDFDYPTGFSYDLIKNTLKKISVSFKKGNVNFIDNVIELFLSFSKRGGSHIFVEFKLFFEETNTSVEAFNKIYSKLKKEHELGYELVTLIVSIANNQIIDLLIKEIQLNKISDYDITLIRNFLNQPSSNEQYNLFYTFLLDSFGDKYKQVENIYEIKRIEKEVKDRKLLETKTEFLHELELFYNKFDKNELTFDELYDFRKQEGINLDSNIILDTLRNWAKEESPIELKTILETLGDESRWLWFKLNKLVSNDTQNNEENYFNNSEIKFISDWAKESIKTANFISAVTANGQNYEYRRAELYLVYFAERLGVEFTTEDYLNFLFIDCDLVPFKRLIDNEKKEDHLISEFIISKVGLELTKKRILDNLNTHEMNKRVKNNYFQFFKNNDIKEGIEFIYKEILGDNYSEYDKRLLINFYIDLGGALQKLEALIDNVPDELNSFLIDKLIDEKSLFINDYCLKKYSQVTSNEFKLRFISYLMKIDSPSAIPYLKEWIIQNKQIPEIRNYSVSVINYDDLVLIYEDCLFNNYGNNYWHDTKDIFMSSIIELSGRDKIFFNKTKHKIENWIKKDKSYNFLYYQIQRLENLYYSNMPQAISFNEVEQIFANPKIDSKVILFWYRYRNPILNISTIGGFILTVISFIFLILQVLKLIK